MIYGSANRKCAASHPQFNNLYEVIFIYNTQGTYDEWTYTERVVREYDSPYQTHHYTSKYSYHHFYNMCEFFVDETKLLTYDNTCVEVRDTTTLDEDIFSRYEQKTFMGMHDISIFSTEGKVYVTGRISNYRNGCPQPPAYYICDLPIYPTQTKYNPTDAKKIKIVQMKTTSMETMRDPFKVFPNYGIFTIIFNSRLSLYRLESGDCLCDIELDTFDHDTCKWIVGDISPNKRYIYVFHNKVGNFGYSSFIVGYKIDVIDEVWTLKKIMQSSINKETEIMSCLSYDNDTTLVQLSTGKILIYNIKLSLKALCYKYLIDKEVDI